MLEQQKQQKPGGTSQSRGDSRGDPWREGVDHRADDPTLVNGGPVVEVGHARWCQDNAWTTNNRPRGDADSVGLPDGGLDGGGDPGLERGEDLGDQV